MNENTRIGDLYHLWTQAYEEDGFVPAPGLVNVKRVTYGLISGRSFRKEIEKRTRWENWTSLDEELYEAYGCAPYEGYPPLEDDAVYFVFRSANDISEPFNVSHSFNEFLDYTLSDSFVREARHWEMVDKGFA